MFLDFYRLREQPFGVTPDPRYLYLGPGHREALASLFYGIETGRGFQSLIAEPGMGKTTLLNQLLLRW
ncbi:MAG: peptidoglycan-binding protein, partial [Acidobacteria bacterium]